MPNLPPPHRPPFGPFGQGRGMGGFGGRGGAWRSANPQAFGPMHTYLVAAMAEALGMSVDDLNAALASGKTMAQVALEKGFTLEQFWTLMQQAREKAIAQMVANGVITQEQANWMLSRMQSRGGPGNFGCPGMGGWGRGRGRWWNAPPATPTPGNGG